MCALACGLSMTRRALSPVRDTHAKEFPPHTVTHRIYVHTYLTHLAYCLGITGSGGNQSVIQIKEERTDAIGRGCVLDARCCYRRCCCKFAWGHELLPRTFVVGRRREKRRAEVVRERHVGALIEYLTGEYLWGSRLLLLFLLLSAPLS